MPKRFIPKINSANDLLMGEVFRTARASGWASAAARAAIARDEEGGERLPAAGAQPNAVAEASYGKEVRNAA